MVLWIKALHIIAIVTWFAGLFYLPRLFAYHAESEDSVSINRFKTMERKLLNFIMWPSMIVVVLAGLSLIGMGGHSYFKTHFWLEVKLPLVLILIFYHIYCSFLVRNFRLDNNTKSPRFYRIFNEVPSMILIIVVILSVVKPF